MDEAQKQAIKHAYSDLVGAYEAYMRKELFNHDCEAHQSTRTETQSTNSALQHTRAAAED